MDIPKITPQQLIEMLAATRRHVTGRVLTSWREKGLLPKLQLRGRGRGIGTVQVWTEPDILEWAIILYDVLCQNRRRDHAMWVLWFCGFPVSPKVVRRIWLQRLKRGKLKRRREPGELVADKYVEDIERLTRGLAKVPQFDKEFIARPIATEIVLAVNEPPSLAPNQDELETLHTATSHLLIDKKLLGATSVHLTELSLKKLQHIFRSFVSLDATAAQLEAASDNDLLCAQAYLVEIGRICLALAKTNKPPADWQTQQVQLRCQLAPVLGPPIFRVILRVIQSGNETRLRKTADLLAEVLGGGHARQERVPCDSVGSDVLGNLISIWNDLDPAV